MALSLPVSRGLFIQMQEYLCHVKSKRVTLSKGVHEDLADFRWLAEDVSNLPTRIYELILLQPTMYGYHNASSYMYGGVVLQVLTAIPRILPLQPSAKRSSPNPTVDQPMVRRKPFPKDIVDSLVSWTNPQGTVNNSELELAGGIIHSDCAAQCFVVTERTVFS